MRIFKWDLEVTDLQILELPRLSEIMTVQMQGNTPQLWALCDEKTDIKDKRYIAIYGTGNPIPDTPGKYISTFQTNDGALVFHAFEAYVEQEIENKSLTSCWRCTTFYSSDDHNCPSCQATKANYDLVTNEWKPYDHMSCDKGFPLLETVEFLAGQDAPSGMFKKGDIVRSSAVMTNTSLFTHWRPINDGV